MAGPRPSDNYNPTPNVAPETGMPSDYLSVRANPSETGGLVAEQLQKAGQTGEQLGNQAYALAIERQGQLNETYATNGENTSSVQNGDTLSAFHQLEGLTAVNQKNQYINQLLDQNAKIRASLPNDAARRAFDQMSLRRTGFMINQIEDYAASQGHQAFRQSQLDTISNTLNTLSDPTVANNEVEFGHRVGTLQFSVMSYLQPEFGNVMHLNNTTGEVTFDKSDQGQQAQAMYERMMDDNLTKAYSNRADTLAFGPGGDVGKAITMLEQADKSGHIPHHAYAQLIKQLNPQFRAYQAKDIAETTFGKAYDEYNQQFENPDFGKNYNLGQIQYAFVQQETGGKGKNRGQLQPDIWKTYGEPGADINNPDDNWKAQTKYLEALEKDPKIGNDPERLAVAYFSGPENVSDPGSALPYKNGDKSDGSITTKEYVSQFMQKLELYSGATPGFETFGDFLKRHSADLEDHAGMVADSVHNNDAGFNYQARQQVRDRVSQWISAADGEKIANYDKLTTFIGTLNPQTGFYPTTEAEINADPQMRQAWQWANANNPIGAANIRTHLLPNNAKQQSLEYGSAFNDYLMQVLSGKLKDFSTIPISNDSNSPLTMTGLRALQQITSKTKTATDQAFNNQEAEFFRTAYNIFTGAALTPDQSPVPSGLKAYNTWLHTVIPQIEQLKAEGKTDIFSEKSSDYVGKAIIPMTPSKASPEIMKALLSGKLNKNQANNQPLNYGSLQDTVAAVKAGKITYEQGVAYANSKGWIAKEGPKPVAPEVPVPK